MCVIVAVFNEGYWNNTCILLDAQDPYIIAPFACAGDAPITNFTITLVRLHVLMRW